MNQLSKLLINVGQIFINDEDKSALDATNLVHESISLKTVNAKIDQ